MKVRRQTSANARRKHLKVQHHKVNSRRQYILIKLSVNSKKEKLFCGHKYLITKFLSCFFLTSTTFKKGR